MEHCCLCMKDFTFEDIVMSLELGRITEWEGTVGFEKDCNPILYAHFECVNKLSVRKE